MKNTIHQIFTLAKEGVAIPKRCNLEVFVRKHPSRDAIFVGQKERLAKMLKTHREREREWECLRECLCLRGRHRGGCNFTSFLRFSEPLFSCSKMSLFYLKTCTPVKVTPWSTAWKTWQKGSHHTTLMSLKDSTLGIMWCDVGQPDLWCEVAEGLSHPGTDVGCPFSAILASKQKVWIQLHWGCRHPGWMKISWFWDYKCMAITSISGPKKTVKFSIFPSFIIKITQKNPHTWCGCFSRFNIWSSSSSLPFLALVFHLFSLLLDFLKPKSDPSNEVIGCSIYLRLDRESFRQTKPENGRFASWFAKMGTILAQLMADEFNFSGCKFRIALQRQMQI